MSHLAERTEQDVTRTIAELSEIASDRAPRNARVSRAADLIRRTGQYRWVGIYDVANDEITVISWSGIGAPAFPSFSVSQGLNGAAVRSGKAVVVGDVRKDPRYLTTFGTTRSEIVLPISRPGSSAIVGTVDVESEESNAFEDGDAAVLQRFADALVMLWSEQ